MFRWKNIVFVISCHRFLFNFPRKIFRNFDGNIIIENIS